MFVGYCPHTKGYRVRLKGRTVVSPCVHFVEEKSGASAIGLGTTDVPFPIHEVPQPPHEPTTLSKGSR
jgi:hypothetical protein